MITRDEIITELREVELDLAAFRSSKDAIQRRVNSLEGSPRQDDFVHWAATQAALNVLIMAITRCEGLIEDYRRVLEGIDAPDNVLKLERKP